MNWWSESVRNYLLKYCQFWKKFWLYWGWKTVLCFGSNLNTCSELYAEKKYCKAYAVSNSDSVKNVFFSKPTWFCCRELLYIMGSQSIMHDRQNFSFPPRFKNQQLWLKAKCDGKIYCSSEMALEGTFKYNMMLQEVGAFLI